MLFILFTFLVAQTRALSSQATSQEKSDHSLLIGFAIVATILLAVWYYDRRNNHMYTRAVRGAIGDFIVRYRSRKNYKTDIQQPQTPKAINFNHEQTYINAIPKREFKEPARAEEILAEEIESDTPKPDFKGVFEIKESKSKHKANKKSKSKLKGRLLGKVGDDEEQGEGAAQGQISTLIENSQRQKANQETEDYKNIEISQ